MINQKATHLIFGTVTGLITYSIIGKLGLYLLQTCWTDYAIHSQDKLYTFEMFLSRLGVGIIAAITAGVATHFANGGRRSAWFTGIIVFCIAAYIHLLTATWNQYPVWYRFAYLVHIIPVTGLSQYIFNREKYIPLSKV